MHDFIIGISVQSYILSTFNMVSIQSLIKYNKTQQIKHHHSHSQKKYQELIYKKIAKNTSIVNFAFLVTIGSKSGWKCHKAL